jgi:hypothetical protein
MHALATKVLAGTNDSSLGSVMANFLAQPSSASGAATFDETWISGLANDLMAKPGASLVLVGPSQPVALHQLGYAINAALKNLGQTLLIRQTLRNPRTIEISQLAADINDGRIKHLFILGGDPV